MLKKTLLVIFLVSTALTRRVIAQQTPPQQPPAETTAPETQIGEVVVTAKRVAGGGLLAASTASQVVQTVSKQYISQQVPSANPSLLIADLPSVNVSASDAFGLSGGVNVQIHGLPAFDLGFVLDGMPVYNSGSAYSNETVDAEDLTTISVAPGTTTIDAPTIGSSAGTMYMTMRDPSLKAGGTINLAGGTQSYNREYLRLDTGKIASSNLRGFVSFSHNYANNWRGGGYNEKFHLDSKWVLDWGNNSRVSFEASINRQYYTYYFYPTAQQFANYSADFDQFNVHSTYEGFGDGAYYRLNQQTPSYAMVFGLPVHWVVNDHIVVDDTPYFWAFRGAGTGGDVLTVGQTYQGTQPANVDLTRGGAIQPTNGQILVDAGFAATTYQAGNVAKVTTQIGNNTILAGWWYENYINYERDPVGVVNQATGVPGNPWDSGNIYKLANGSDYLVNDSNERYILNSIFAGDTVALLNDRLTLSAGGRYIMITPSVQNFLPGALRLNKTTFNSFLPQGQLHYRFDDHNSMYADIEKDFSLPFLTSVTDYYSINSGLQTSAPSKATPETALKEEIGYRFANPFLLADISFFNINLKNHLLTLNVYENGLPEAITANAGNQSSRGIDLQLGTSPIHDIAPYLSFEYLNSHTESDIADVNTGGLIDYLPTNGKVSVQAPKFQAAIGLTYANGPFTAGVRLRWVDSQYSDLMNQESMPSFITNDFSLSYRFPDWGRLHDSRLQLNVSNIANGRYRTGVFYAPLNAQDTVGTQGGTIPGSSPSYYVYPAFAAMVSLTTSF